MRQIGFGQPMSPLLSLFLILFFSAAQDSLYLGKIQKIHGFSKLDLETFKGQKSIWYFFQPECSSCKKQSQHLSCLPKDTPILAVGVLGSLTAVQKEFKKHVQRAVPVWGGEDWQKKLKIQKTPTILIVDKDGAPVFRQESFLNCEDLLKQWKKITY